MLLPLKPLYDSDGDNTAQLVKGSSTVLHFLEVSNMTTVDAYIQLFNAATAAEVTVGTTVPALSLLVPAGNGTLAGAMDKYIDKGIAFDRGLVYACTTTPTGNGDPSTGLNVNMLYQ